MPAVTVTGANGHAVSLNFSTSENRALAEKLAGAITAGVKSGQLTPASSKDGPPPGLPLGGKGEFVQQTSGVTFLPSGYVALVNDSKNSTIFGSGDDGEMVLSGTKGMTFIATGGSGTVAAAGGKNNIVVPPTDAGAWLISTGAGNDTVAALGSGNNTIQAGGGKNQIVLGSGRDLAILTGTDTVFAASGGTDTIDASGAKSAVVRASGGNMLFVGGAGSATVFGGTGSDTVFGGSGRMVVHGGAAGNNLLFAGTGQATLFGGGSGDMLFAQGDKGQVLRAGAGNETLSSILSTGKNTLHGGSGQDQMVGGFGMDTFVTGNGSATISGGFGEDLFEFVKGVSGGRATIVDFESSDKIVLSGYESQAVQNALKSQVSAGGSTTITLSDRSTITFSGVANLKSSDFQNGGSHC